MDKELIEKLLQAESVKYLIDYLLVKIDEMDRLPDIKLDDPIELSIEVKARKLAVDKVREILEPLIGAKNESVGSTNKDFQVDV